MKHKSWFLRRALPVCLCLTLLAGCGGGGGEVSESSETSAAATDADSSGTDNSAVTDGSVPNDSDPTDSSGDSNPSGGEPTAPPVQKEGVLKHNALYKIVSDNDGYVMASNKFGLSANAFVVSQGYCNDLNQIWRAIQQEDGSYVFENMSSRQYMTLKKNAEANGTAICVSEFKQGNKGQMWTLEESGKGRYRLLSAATGKPVETKDGAKTAGTQIVQNDKTSGKEQIWTFEKVSDGDGQYPYMMVVSGALTGSSCPEIIRQGDTYYAYNMGNGIGIKRSKDLQFWESIGSVFPNKYPYEWMEREVPGGSIWAPGVYKIGDLYYCYYCCSTSGSQNSAIGVAVNKTLEKGTKDYSWVDKGLVIRSYKGVDDYNCIDPNIFIDDDGQPWLIFGSYWGGIKMRKIDPSNGMLDESDTTTYTLANRTERPGGIEAPYVIKRGEYYYLFVAIGNFATKYYCGVGRSKSLTGPYVDRDGKPMMEGGHTAVTDYKDGITKVGHASIFRDTDRDYLVSEYFWENSGSMMLISSIEWTKDGWPVTALNPDVLKSLGE